MNRAVIQVDGMTCEGCASLVADAIRKVPNVLAVEVDYAKGEAVVGSEICCPVPTQAILTALRKAGYSGHVDAVDAPHEVEAASAAEKLSPLLDLSTDAREFREAFNRSKGSVRVVMLVSPG